MPSSSRTYSDLSCDSSEESESESRRCSVVAAASSKSLTTYRSISKRGGEIEDSSSETSSSEDDKKEPTARNRLSAPMPRSTGLLIAGVAVVLVLLTVSGMALISYHFNKRQEQPAGTTPTEASSSSSSPSTVKSPPPSATLSSASPTPSPTSQTASSTSTSFISPSASANSSSSTSTDLSLLTSLGITSFLGQNTGIGSWYRTDSAQDSTNGNSWCGCPYTDSVPAFAPSLKTMLSNFNDVYEDAGRAWCGLEAKFTAPNGNEALLVIGDAFDDAWVLSPGSVDIIYESFAKLYGKETSNKEDVIKELKWEFTGRQIKKYTFEVCR